ncbi:oligosaccharide flippase family protein [Aliivibrio fischeri]|uniref:oligosaccharide flippase family protein n=2 Tax=Aliivibrio fischeri TaxID=668 RepID=UPI0012DADBA6|nr:polysaccharide biosynthesis C-terminal domain-containing protein [Aliivibrio fischeri]MUI63805.1 oligosaccharide flippase family protein [Aliivibrio fischeri]
MNSIYFVLSKSIVMGLTFFITSLIAKKYGVDEFGYYSYLKAIFGMIFVVSSLCNDPYLISKLIDKKNDNDIKILNLFRIILFTTLSLLTYFLYSENGYIFISIYFLYFLQLINFPIIIMNIKKMGFRVFKTVTLITILISLFLLGSEYFFKIKNVYLYVLPLFYFLYLLFLFPNSNVGRLYSFNSVLNSSLYFRSKIIFKDIWPIFLASILIYIYTRVDIFIINHVMNVKDVGIYSVAIQLSEPFSFVVSAYAMSIISDLKKIESKIDRDSFLIKKLRMIHFYVVVIIITFLFFGELFISYLYGVEYISSYKVTVILLCSKIFTFSNLFFSIIMIVDNNIIPRLIRTVYAIIISVILNFIFIYNYGLMGAAFSTVISQFISVSLLNYISKKTRDYSIIFIRSFTS